MSGSTGLGRGKSVGLVVTPILPASTSEPGRLVHGKAVGLVVTFGGMRLAKVPTQGPCFVQRLGHCAMPKLVPTWDSQWTKLWAMPLVGVGYLLCRRLLSSSIWILTGRNPVSGCNAPPCVC